MYTNYYLVSLCVSVFILKSFYMYNFNETWSQKCLRLTLT